MSEVNSHESKVIDGQKIAENAEIKVQVQQQKLTKKNNESSEEKVLQSIDKQKKQEDPISNHQKVQLKPDLMTEQKLAIKAELQSMQFEPQLINEAVKHASTLDQAIEFIINKIEQKEKEELGFSKQVKLFFIVRMDLKMGTGKIAAQVGHASLRAFQNMRFSCSTNDQNAALLIEWMQNGRKTKILQAETQNDLHFYLDKAGNKFINNCYIRDAGRTQIAAGSMTVAAIGPLRECDAEFLKNLQQL